MFCTISYTYKILSANEKVTDRFSLLSEYIHPFVCVSMCQCVCVSKCFVWTKTLKIHFLSDCNKIPFKCWASVSTIYMWRKLKIILPYENARIKKHGIQSIFSENSISYGFFLLAHNHTELYKWNVLPDQFSNININIFDKSKVFQKLSFFSPTFRLLFVIKNQFLVSFVEANC